ncbi:protein-L-isoaspartate(D-aspartate) O-methyltransferase [Nocardiopsis sp. MG754419]|uniref:protein-L-isoaspartate(D-aspartate) O-methyltransferase n=1 Tax=Nocardiopsis sp. MG754419 TaxID=2259865 RepID=UPI001BADE203|nr:protein-L-isoaspartate(D-aspartate) O-methyltransferase [Nocardiopsis sp. MG754419]MBR8742463.1 protein-L-isoaspartate(D-aspartate) O-methyltransferase [Nocardiopsis sp. MG754419]
MVDRLREEVGVGPAWELAFTDIPRHLFLPGRFVLDDGRGEVDRWDDEERWLEAAYADEGVTVGHHPGAGRGGARATGPVCSPSRAADLLVRADLTRGMQVLEIGTGSGYCTALLSGFLGEEAVTSVEIDIERAEHARVNLLGAGFAPSVVGGDGAVGRAARAPFDRVLSSVPIVRVPSAWAAQCLPGGRILTRWGWSFSRDLVADLRVGVDGRARGRFAIARPCGPTLSGYHEAALISRFVRPGTEERTRTCALDARDLTDESSALCCGLALPGVHRIVRPAMLGSDLRVAVYLIDPVSGSWALGSTGAEAPGGILTRQRGPRMLFDEWERVHRCWQEAGRPVLSRFGVTATPVGQTIWLDDETSVWAVTE